MSNIYRVSTEHLKERLNSTYMAALIKDVLGFNIDIERVQGIKSQKTIQLFNDNSSVEERFYSILSFKSNSLSFPSSTNSKEEIVSLNLKGVKNKDLLPTIMASSFNALFDNDLQNLSIEEKQLLKINRAATFVAWWIENIGPLASSTKLKSKPPSLDPSSCLYFLSNEEISLISKNTSLKPILQFFEPVLPASPEYTALLTNSLNPQNAKEQAQELLEWKKNKTLDFDWDVSPSYLETSWSDLEYALKKCNVSISNILNVDPKLLVDNENYLKFAHHFLSHFQVFNSKDSYSYAWNLSANGFKDFGSKENTHKAVNLFLSDNRFLNVVKANPNLAIQILAGFWKTCHNHDRNLYYTGTSAENILLSIFREILKDTSIISLCSRNEIIFLSGLLTEKNLLSKDWQDFILNPNFPGKTLQENNGAIKSYWKMYEKTQDEELLITILKSLSPPDLDSIGWSATDKIKNFLKDISEELLKTLINANPTLIMNVLNRTGSPHEILNSLSARSEAFLDSLWNKALDKENSFSAIDRLCYFDIAQSSPIEKFKTPAFINAMLETLDYTIHLKKGDKINTPYIVSQPALLAKILKKSKSIDVSLIPSQTLCQAQILDAFEYGEVVDITGQMENPFLALQKYLSLEEQKSLVLRRPEYLRSCAPAIKRDKDCVLQYLTLIKKSRFDYFNTDVVEKEYWSSPDFCAQIVDFCGLETFKKLKLQINPLVWNNQNFALKMAGHLDKLEQEEYDEFISACAPHNVKKFFAALELKPGTMTPVLESCFLKLKLVSNPLPLASPRHKI